MIITVPVSRLCIKSKCPVMIRHSSERTLYEVMQKLGPVLLEAYGFKPRGPPVAA